MAIPGGDSHDGSVQVGSTLARHFGKVLCFIDEIVGAVHLGRALDRELAHVNTDRLRDEILQIVRRIVIKVTATNSSVWGLRHRAIGCPSDISGSLGLCCCWLINDFTLEELQILTEDLKSKSIQIDSLSARLVDTMRLLFDFLVF